MSAPAPRTDIGKATPYDGSKQESVANFTPDWFQLGLGFDLTVNGHIEVRHHQSTEQWTAPELVCNPNIAVSGLSPALNYGQQCYEGLKAFRSPNNTISVFRPEFHWARFCQSAESVSLPPPPKELFLKCIQKAVAANAEFVPPAETEAYLYIRPVLFGASARLALAPPEEVVLAVYVQPARPYHGSAAVDGLVLDDFDRAAPRGMGGYKVGGNYAPVWRHAAKAKDLGYGITLHLDSATRSLVEEFSTSGFLGHKMVGGKHVLVVPKAEGAIASATSDSMVRLAEREGWVVERAEVPLASLGSLDEVVAVGTAAAAVPVRSITRLSTDEKYAFSNSDGESSRILELARLMMQIQRGKTPDLDGWCWEVTGYSETAPVLGSLSMLGSLAETLFGRIIKVSTAA